MIRTGGLQQASRDAPAEDDWLAASELAVLARLAVPKRRDEWRLGRWTSKLALSSSGAAPLRGFSPGAPGRGCRAWSRLAVTSAGDGAPEAFLDGEPLPIGLSITHRAGLAACLVGPAGAQVGCDIELIEPRDEWFVHDYFTPGERSAVVSSGGIARALTTTIIWSAKESALKALRTGLSTDTREVDVRLLPWPEQMGWRGFVVRRRDRPRLLSGWWGTDGRTVVTAVIWPPGDPPVQLGSRAVPSP